MSIRVLHIPAKNLNEARRVVHAIEAGIIPCLKQYLDESQAKASAQVLTKLHHVPYTVIPITMIDGIEDTPPARRVEKLGQAVAAFLLVIGGAYAVGLGSLL